MIDRRACAKGDKVWPSIRAASSDVGRSPSYIKPRCDEKLAGWGWVDTPTKAKKSGPRTLPYIIRGVEYGSLAEAAKAVKVSRNSILLAFASGKQDLVGLKPRGPRSALPVTDGTTTYPTLTAAGATIGVRADMLKKMIERGETKFRFITKEP